MSSLRGTDLEKIRPETRSLIEDMDWNVFVLKHPLPRGWYRYEIVIHDRAEVVPDDVYKTPMVQMSGVYLPVLATKAVHLALQKQKERGGDEGARND